MNAFANKTYAQSLAYLAERFYRSRCITAGTGKIQKFKLKELALTMTPQPPAAD